MSKVDQVVAYGMAEIGKPYVFGDEGPNTFDCSGLMQWIFAKVGIKLPRVAREQQGYATPVSTPRVGDLVFWGTPATHVGLYVGGNRVLHAPNSRSVVKVSTIWGSPNYGRVSGLGTGPIAAPINAITQPVAFGMEQTLDRLSDAGRVLLVAAGGVLLVGLGAWQATKGVRG